MSSQKGNPAVQTITAAPPGWRGLERPEPALPGTHGEPGWPAVAEPAGSGPEPSEAAPRQDGRTDDGHGDDGHSDAAPTDGALEDVNVAQPAGHAGEDVPPAVSRTALPAEALPRPAQTRVLTVANQKGGVGKTTSTVNIAAALALAGLRVLVIDTDPQGNASTALGIEHHAEVPSIYEVLVSGTALTDVVQPCPDIPGLSCVPATIDLAGAEIELVSLVAREQRLQRALSTFLATHPVDYVFIDCPPSLGLLTVNAFVAASEVLIPIQCEYYALEGLSQLLKNVEMIRTHLNPDLLVSTILMTMYDGRTKLSAQVADEVRQHFPELVLRTTVPRSVRVSEAPSYGQTVLTYDPVSSGALCYIDAARELASRATTSPSEVSRET